VSAERTASEDGGGVGNGEEEVGVAVDVEVAGTKGEGNVASPWWVGEEVA
jgi:hypothetical protein